MSGLVNNFNSFVDTKDYSANIKQQIKQALSDKELTGEEIANLKKSFNNDAAFESALKDIITSKGVEEFKKHENNPSEFEFAFTESTDKKAQVTLKTIESALEDGVCEVNPEDNMCDINETPIGEIDLAIPDKNSEVNKPVPQNNPVVSPDPVAPESTGINNEEYITINDTIKNSKSNKENGVTFHSNSHKNPETGVAANYITLPPAKLAEVKSFQGFIGTDNDGFIGPNTLGALMKKYDILQAKGDTEGLAQLNKFVDDLGLKNIFKGKILGKSLDEIASPQKPAPVEPVQTQEKKEITKPEVTTPASNPVNVAETTPVAKAGQTSQPPSTNVDKCLTELGMAVMTSNPSGITKVITEKVMNLQPQEFKEFMTKIIGSDNKKSTFGDLVPKIASAYEKASNYDKRVLDMAVSLIQEGTQNLKDTISKDTSPTSKDRENLKQNILNMDEFVATLKKSPAISTKNGPNPTGFDKDKILSSIRGLLLDNNLSIDQRREKLISNVPTLLSLDDKSYSEFMDSFKQNGQELTVLLKKLDELKQGASKSDLFELSFIQKKIIEHVTKKS